MEPSKLRRLKMNFFLCTTGAMLTGIIADLVYHLFSTEWSQREMMLVLGFLFSRVMQLSDEILDLLVCQILSIDGYIYIYTLPSARQEQLSREWEQHFSFCWARHCENSAVRKIRHSHNKQAEARPVSARATPPAPHGPAQCPHTHSGLAHLSPNTDRAQPPVQKC